MKKQSKNVFNQERRVGYFQKENPGKTIYIGNLSYQMSEKDIFQLFKPFGTVKYVKLVVDGKNLKPKGIAFVQMPKPNEALKAITTLDGQVIGGRTVKVSEALERDIEVPTKRQRPVKEK